MVAASMFPANAEPGRRETNKLAKAGDKTLPDDVLLSSKQAAGFT
jgi:hypothetical protein